MKQEALPFRVLLALLGAALFVAVIAMSLPDWLHVQGHRAQVHVAILTATFLAASLLTPISIWRWKLAPGSFRKAHPDPRVTIGWNVAVTTFATAIAAGILRSLAWH